MCTEISVTGADVLFSVKMNCKTQGQEHADCSIIQLSYVYLESAHFKSQSKVTTGHSVVFLSPAGRKIQLASLLIFPKDG
jgi:hypothetical protein